MIDIAAMVVIKIVVSREDEMTDTLEEGLIYSYHHNISGGVLQLID